MTKDVNVFIKNFPNTKEAEAITENPDGTYTIFLNARMSYERQLEAYQHALEHIQNNDFQKLDVQQIEAIAHADQTTKEPIVTQKKKRRRRNRYRQYEKQRRALEAFGVDAWSQHEAHWLDPDCRF